MLLFGCCAVRDSPLVCVWNFNCNERGFFAWNFSFKIFAYTFLATLNLATSSKNSIVQQKKKDKRGAKSSIFNPLSKHV